MPAAVLKVGGTARTMKGGSLSLIENINGRSTLRAGVISLDGSYAPAVDDAVVLEDGSSNVLFGGSVADPDAEWVLQGSTLITTITAEDYTALADRRLVKAATTAGYTVRQVVDAVISTYLSAYGVTRDAGMAAGATLGALTYDYATVTDVFNDLVRLAAPAGWVWKIDENKVAVGYLPSLGANPCPFSLSSGSDYVEGDIKVTRSRQGYANKVTLVYGDGTSTPAEVNAEDIGEQATYGIYETVIRSEGPLDVTTAQAVVDGYLAKVLVRPRTIVFATRQAGARVGQTIPVNLSARGLVADFLITTVETTDLGGKYLRYKLTAIEGGTVAGDWKDTFKAWGGGSSGVASTGGISLITAVVGRAAYPLGGSGIAAEQSSGPSVINAVGYIDVMLDSAALPSGTSVTAVVQCKTASAGVTVTPQIYNVTTAAVAGTGSGVTGTSWTTVNFAITVAAGQNYYRLRMTPGTADVDCYSLGYLEVGR